jgi:hypothetical protein
MDRAKASRIASAVFVALVAGLLPVWSGGVLIIEDDPEPIPTGKAVSVTVKNTSSETRKGVVTVQATVDGKLASASAPVQLGGGQTTTVVVSFGSTVQSVSGAGIIEDPDPIPQ